MEKLFLCRGYDSITSNTKHFEVGNLFILSVFSLRERERGGSSLIDEISCLIDVISLTITSKVGFQTMSFMSTLRARNKI